MQKRPAASIDPLHPPGPRFQFRGLKADVLTASLTADRDDRPELVQKNGAPPVAAGDLMPKASLDRQRTVPVQRAQQVRLQPAPVYLGSPAPIHRFSTIRHSLVPLGIRSF